MPRLFRIIPGQFARGRFAGSVLGLSLAAAVGALASVAGCNNNNQPPAVNVAGPNEPTKDVPQGAPLFQDVTAQTGIQFTYRNGEEANNYAIIESLGGGVALIDYDGDGRLDIL